MNRIFAGLLAFTLIFSGIGEMAAASKGSSRPSASKSSGSSRPSSSFGSSSKPKSSFGSSKPSGSSRPSSSFGSSKPSGSSRPSSSFGSSKPSGSSRPSSSKPLTTTNNSSKPNLSFDTKAATAQKKAESKVAYQAATKPKEAYVAPSGKVVKIDPKDSSVSTIRNTVTPKEFETRTNRVEHHYHNHYGDRYDYYRSRPYVDIGGGYSSIFWYAMLDWNAQRRAEWLYHNQHRINADLYAQQLQNAELRLEIEKLKLNNVAVNPNYVDKEFSDNPDLMYDDNYVAATYNPAPVAVSQPLTSARTGSWRWLWWIVGIGVLGGFVWLFFIKDWKVKE